MQILNQYSYVFISLGILTTSALVMYVITRGRLRLVIATEIVIALLLVAGFLVLRPGSGDIETVDDARALLTNGRPTFVEFFSNYCTGCLVVRPSVDQLISEIDDEYNILRINIHTAAGRELSETYDFSFTPEFVVFDRGGREVFREHALPPADILTQAGRVSRR
jgi:thiol-disulfide isomerase/thioredoxin